MRPHNIIVDSRTLPKPEELYEGGLKRTPWGWIYAHTIEPAKEWVADHGIATTAAAVVAVGAITASIILPNALGKEARPISQTTQANTQPGIVIDASSIYRSQVRDALLQDVPELANYRSALDYTTQRVVDMKNVYGLTLEQVRSPVTKWVNANIEWDKIGERLVPFSEEIDFIPDTLFAGNATFDLETNKKTGTLEPRWNISSFEQNTSVIISNHNQIWKDLQNPEFVDKYLEQLESLRTYEGVNATFPPYAKAIRTLGTDVDKKHWALYMKGREDALYLGSGEEIRKQAAQTRILSVGGKAKIEIWGFIASDLIKRPNGTLVNARHGDLAVYESATLYDEIEKNPSIYGTPLNRNGYLGVLPNLEGVAIQGTSVIQQKIAVMWLEAPTRQLGMPNRVYIYGDEATAIKYGHNN